MTSFSLLLHSPSSKRAPLYVIAKSTVFPCTGLGNGYLVLAIFLLKIFNFYIVPVFTKVCMIQIWLSGSSDLAVFYLAHHVFYTMCVMPPMFLATQWNSFWQHLDKVYCESFFTSQSWHQNGYVAHSCTNCISVTVPVFISLIRVCQVQNKLGSVPRSNVSHQFCKGSWPWCKLLFQLYHTVNHGFIWFRKLQFIFLKDWLEFVLHHAKSVDCNVL